MPEVYNNLGVQFLYPENWKITDEDRQSWPRTVSVQSPGGGFWSLSIYAPGANPGELANTILETMKQELEQFEAEAIEETIAGTKTTGYEMAFYCLNLVVIAHLRVFQLGVRTIVLLYQAESREFDQIKMVFQAMTESLLREENASA